MCIRDSSNIIPAATLIKLNSGLSNLSFKSFFIEIFPLSLLFLDFDLEFLFPFVLVLPTSLVPRNLDDVAAFSDSSTPMITGVTPASLSFEAAGGEKTLTVSVINQGDNQLSVSGLTDRKSTRLNSSHITRSRMPSSA